MKGNRLGRVFKTPGWSIPKTWTGVGGVIPPPEIEKNYSRIKTGDFPGVHRCGGPWVQILRTERCAAEVLGKKGGTLILKLQWQP